MAGVVVAWCLVVLFMNIFSCVPVNGYWNYSLKARCLNPAKFYIGVAVPNVVTDVVILALPIRMVLRLQADVIQKIALIITFLTGSL